MKSAEREREDKEVHFKGNKRRQRLITQLQLRFYAIVLVCEKEKN
jgi:hypothetical protein